MERTLGFDTINVPDSVQTRADLVRMYGGLWFIDRLKKLTDMRTAVALAATISGLPMTVTLGRIDAAISDIAAHIP
jgi:hypothetical protein